MKVTDYIVQFLKSKGIVDVFGYQGTMIAHFIDSICNDSTMKNHSCYNEQGAAFAACGYSKVSGRTSVAYATSGPGALNLLSGIADAYYDSVPVIFITGQLNTTEYTEINDLRQQGFQQTNVVEITKAITKYSVFIDNAENIIYLLEKAFAIANEGRKGPVLLDIPMNIQRAEIDLDNVRHFTEDMSKKENEEEACQLIFREIQKAKAPIFLVGNGVRLGDCRKSLIKDLVEKYNIPLITSMLARDILPYNHKLNFGFIGSGYGHRFANLIAYKKADLIISLGCSMCRRQTGIRTEKFAENATIIRVDIDEIELKRKVHKNETSIVADANLIINRLLKKEYVHDVTFDEWLKKCNYIKKITQNFDDLCLERIPNKIIYSLSNRLKTDCTVVSDVGQHQVWCAQSFQVKDGQKMLFSGGHGAMGFALPAAIGAYYATRRPVICIAGDGAFQMNIQELQWVKREQIPILILVLNNSSLGLIQQQQDDFFGGKHYGSGIEGGYVAPCFSDIGNAYGIDSYTVSSENEINDILNKNFVINKPILIEIYLANNTKAYPKTYFGEEMFNQRPLLDVDILNELLEI